MGDIALVEEAFNRLKSIKHNEGEVPALAIAISVSGLFVMNSDGIAIRSTMENDVTVHYAALVSRFVEKARAAVKQLNPDDELQFTRIRSQKHEIIIAPEFNKGRDFYLVAIHKPTCE